MDCLKSRCKYYSPEKSEQYGCDFCTVTISCTMDGCPVDRMVRYCADKLTGYKSIQRYLSTL